MERLESRMVLDGNVRAFVSGGTLHIEGDSQANEITIEQSSPHNFTVTSRDGTTLINGAAGPQDFSGVRRNVDIRLRSGDDVVELLGAATDTPLVVPKNLVINTAGGNDQVLMSNVRVTRLNVNTGGGNDVVNIGNSGADGGIFVGRESNILTAGGQDEIDIGNSNFRRLLNLNAGNNNDTVTVQNVTFQRRSNVTGGPGTDTLNREGNTGKVKYRSFETVNNQVNNPLVANDDTGSVTEDSATTTAIGNVLTNDTGGAGSLSVSAVSGVAGNVNTDVPGSFGTFHINADGSFTYTLNNANATVDALNDTQNLTDSIGYTVGDGTSTDTAVLRITIVGHTG
jgi:VCBS repeat-containing protein